MGDYIENINTDKLSLTGNVVINNLVLKKSILDNLNLPIAVVHGSIATLQLRIPWTNLAKVLSSNHRKLPLLKLLIFI